MGQLGGPPRRTFALLMTLCLAVVSCADGSTGDQASTDGSASPDAEWVYDGLADCDPLPTGLPQPPTAGLELPEGMVVTDVTAADPLLQITGLIDATPLQIRDAYATDAALVHLEDEGFEAEVLLDHGPDRYYLRATIRCRTGSVLSVILAPGDAAEALPVPGRLPGGAMGPATGQR